MLSRARRGNGQPVRFGCRHMKSTRDASLMITRAHHPSNLLPLTPARPHCHRAASHGIKLDTSLHCRAFISKMPRSVRGCLPRITARWRPKKPKLDENQVTSHGAEHNNEQDNSSDFYPVPEDYPVFPPPPPRVMIESPSKYWETITARKFGAPQGVFEDSPLFALFRLYEFILLDRVVSYRNAIEAFWRIREWAVEDIPDPNDENKERLAFLAGCTYLIARSFNQRVKLGLGRDNPSLITPEEPERARSVPEDLRPWEKVPGWATAAAQLDDAIYIPTHDGQVLSGANDPRADPDFLAKNIILWTPHISFT